MQVKNVGLLYIQESMADQNYKILITKVRTVGETHKIWKKLPHGFDKSADLLSKHQNHEEDFLKLCVLLKKSELYLPKWLCWADSFKCL